MDINNKKAIDMKINLIKLMMSLILFTALFFTACEDIDPVVESLDLDRYIAPVGIEAKMSKIVEMNLSWTDVPEADLYTLEIYTDSLEFLEENLLVTAEVEENKFFYVLKGDTRYSIRIKMSGEANNESKWNWITFETSVDNKFLESKIGDVGADFAIFRWNPGITATKISLSGGSEGTISQEITAENLETGIVTVEGLEPSTTYSVTLYDDKQKVGLMTINTFPEGVIIINPDDEISLRDQLENAEDGDFFMVPPGEYMEGGLKVSITKNITISGYGENLRPIIHAHFMIMSDVTSFNLINLELDGFGEEGLRDHVVQVPADGAANVGAISMEGCRIKNYNKSFITTQGGKARVESISVNNCVVSDILTNGADFIDFRDGILLNLSLTNSTFYNCAYETNRDIIRLDASAQFPEETAKSKITIDRCTFDKVSKDKRILYVRFQNEAAKVSNCLFTNSNAIYTRQSQTEQPDCSRNNYFNAPLFLGGHADAFTKYDISGSHTTEDPGYENAEKGDFTVKNINVRVGDPRWIQ